MSVFGVVFSFSTLVLARADLSASLITAGPVASLTDGPSPCGKWVFGFTFVILLLVTSPSLGVSACNHRINVQKLKCLEKVPEKV
jgi:hypothetical protein